MGDDYQARSLQALVTGVVAGALSLPSLGVDLEVELVTNERGDYLPEVLVTGRVSRTRLRVSVDVLEDEAPGIAPDYAESAE